MNNRLRPTRVVVRRRVTKERLAFERLVTEAITDMPAEILRALDNIAIVIDDNPSEEHLQAAGLGQHDVLYGLYQGVPLPQRTSYYSLVLPDKITIFQKPIEQACQNRGQVRQMVREVIRHEVAHYFGFSDDDLSF